MASHPHNARRPPHNVRRGAAHAEPGPEPRRPPAWRLFSVVALGALGIAAAAIFVRLALPAPPVVTGFYRMAFALPVLAAVVAWQGGFRDAPTRALGLAFSAGLFFGADLSLWHLALVETSVASATLLVNTTPIPIGLWSLLVLRERPGRPFVAGAFLALCGTTLLLGSDLREGIGWHGGALALGAAFFYAGYLVLIQAARSGLDAWTGTLASTAGGVLVIGVFAAVRGDSFSGFPPHSWATFVAAALVSHVGGVLGIAWALRWLRATFASVALLIQPLGATLLAWWLFDETLSPGQALGGVAVLAGIFVASRGALRTR